MKKIILTILLFCLIPFYANAGNLADLTIRTMPDISQPCGIGALGCCVYQTDTIYIRNNYNLEMFKSVLLHEIGHYLMEDVSYEMYQNVFGEGTYHEVSEKAANHFVSFITLGKFRNIIMSKIEIDFFIWIIGNNH